ncbi:MAG: OmpA family protein [Deltaproteobacteria bacterium]|nr:OmpA family protein [Deltaproteobacteria bacterium]
MGKLDQSGVLVKPSATPPGKIRRFPWRLWLWAILMTAAAGAGGYFTWHFKSRSEDATAAEASARSTLDDKDKALTSSTQSLKDKIKEAKDCADQRAELDKASKTLGDQLKTNKDQLTELAKVLEQNKIQLDAAKQFKSQFAKMVDSGAIDVVTRHGNIVLSLPAQVLFPSGVAELSDDGKIKVHEIGFTLKDKGPKDDKGNFTARYLIVGHSDNQPLKSSIYKDNWDLSMARALTVTRELIAAGMNPKNLLPSGAGDHDPIAPNASVKDMGRNRRIDIVLLPAITDIPESEKGPKK